MHKTFSQDNTASDSPFGDFLESSTQAESVTPFPFAKKEVSEEEEISSEDLNALLLPGVDPLGNSMRTVTASINHDEIKTCFGCEARLGLPALKAGECSETWRCTKCGATFLTGNTIEKDIFIENAEQDFQDSTNLYDNLPTQQPENLERLVKEMSGANYVGPERRTSPRYPISLPAIAIPLDENHQSARSAVQVTLRDISREGLSLFSDIALPQPFLLVDMTSGGFSGAQVVLKVCRSRPLGLMHEIAGTFV